MEQNHSSRRSFIKNSSLLALAGIGSQMIPSGLFASTEKEITRTTTNSFELPELPYKFSDLEPHIDAMTMEIHHGKHHQAYVNGLNKVVTENNLNGTLEELLAYAGKYPAAFRNNGGGHWNHSFFWKLMKPGGGGEPSGKVAEAINQAFGSFDEMKKQLNDSGMKRFGSGWTWLVKTDDGKLEIGSTPNQDNPLMDISELKGKPLLGIDVWEHAYYLKYQNKRKDYLDAWWNLINWDQVAANLG